MQSSTKVIFKDYTQKQLSLLPASLEELIEENHPVSVINQVIDKVDLQKVYLDGTKIEANANKYTFVWGKSIKHYKNGIKKTIRRIMAIC